MNKIKSTLESIEDKLQNKIDARDSIMDNRSEKWQESEKCGEYQEKTEILDNVMGNVTTAIESLDEYLNN